MEISKIHVDKLNAGIGSTYEYLWSGIICGIIAGIVGALGKFGILGAKFTADILIVLTLISCVMWFCFYRYFGVGCKGLKHGISNKVMSIAYLILSMGILNAVALLLGDASSLFIVLSAASTIFGIICTIIYVKLGLVLRQRYEGELGVLGDNIIKSFLYTLGLIAISIVALLLSVLVLSMGNSFLTVILMILLLFIAVGAPVLALILNFKMVWERMVDIIETGYFDMD